MKEFSFKTEIFEGPLDLMLSLVAKHKLDIMDIEISVLLEQFLKYIDAAQEADIELAGEFMEAAARLILIKTASLLPKHEAEQLKKELEGALIEYALCKAAAERLRGLYVGDDVFTREPQPDESGRGYGLTHEPYELVEAVGAVLGRDRLRNEPPPSVSETLNITYVSVFTKIVYVLKKIRNIGKIKVKELFSGQTRSEQVATFLALLELTGRGRIRFSQNLEYLEFVSAKQGE
ncbi:MAG: segregation/condensation protein A [Oscillospiraceae bacterium]|jgi:segregation and condensation protein A|nr:segregation/condensation protein A [Oscillospiraceae bacterium]